MLDPDRGTIDRWMVEHGKFNMPHSLSHSEVDLDQRELVWISCLANRRGVRRMAPGSLDIYASVYEQSPCVHSTVAQAESSLPGSSGCPVSPLICSMLLSSYSH